MRFKESYVNREERYSVGVEEASGMFYVSFPVSNGLVDYEEYYEIDENKFLLFQSNVTSAVAFVARCRRREMDNLLIEKPGTNRGSAI